MEPTLSAQLIETEPKNWFEHLGVSADEYFLFGIAVVEMLIPDWKKRNPENTFPVRAVEAAKMLFESPSDNLILHTKTLAKGCSKSRKKSLGYDHRIAEAVRSIANAAVATSDERRIHATAEAFWHTEDHLKYMYSVGGLYGKEQEIRRSFLDAIRLANAEQYRSAKQIS